MKKNNLFENLPETCGTETFETIFATKGLKVERIVSEGQSTPAGQWYNQEWHEWVALLQGSAGILFDGDDAPVVLKPGDYLLIPAHKKHRVEWTGAHEKTVWLAVHVRNDITR